MKVKDHINKIKVVYLSANRIYFLQLALSLHKYIPDIFVVTNYNEEEKFYLRQLQKDGINVYVNSCFQPSFENISKGIAFMTKLIVYENINVIHVQSVYSLIVAFFSSKIILRKKVLIFYTMHDILQMKPFQKIFLFMGSFIVNICADIIIPVSEDTAKQIIKYGFLKYKINVIHNGINHKLFNVITNENKFPNSLPLTLKNSPHTFISYCANFIPRKGHIYIIIAMYEIIKKYKNTILILTSDGPLKKDVFMLIKKLGFLKNVYFTGKVNYNELYKILNITDIYVSPSLSELFPFAILEAMAAAKPIVATNVGGVSEAVIDMVNGYLVPPKDPGSIAKAIQKLIEDPNKARKMGMEGRRILEQNFSIDIIANKLSNVYARARVN